MALKELTNYQLQNMLDAETDRLLIRRFRLTDADALDRVFGDPEVMQFGPGVQSRAWVRAWLHDILENDAQKPGYGPRAVVDKTSGQVMGYCGLFYFPDLAGQPEIEIGYRLARPFWGQGYATEAVVAVRDYELNVLGLQRLVAMIDPQNTASIRVAEKAGMYSEKEVMLAGYSHPDLLYVIERTLQNAGRTTWPGSPRSTKRRSSFAGCPQSPRVRARLDRPRASRG